MSAAPAELLDPRVEALRAAIATVDGPFTAVDVWIRHGRGLIDAGAPRDQVQHAWRLLVRRLARVCNATAAPETWLKIAVRQALAFRERQPARPAPYPRAGDPPRAPAPAPASPERRLLAAVAGAVDPTELTRDELAALLAREPAAWVALLVDAPDEAAIARAWRAHRAAFLAASVRVFTARRRTALALLERVHRLSPDSALALLADSPSPSADPLHPEESPHVR